MRFNTGAHLAQRLQYFSGVILGAGFFPHAFDVAIGADEERAAHDAEKRLAEELLHAARAVGFDGLEFRVAEQREIDFEALLELEHGVLRIAAAAENGRVGLIELLFRVAKLGRFADSTAGVGLDEEIEHHALAAKIAQRHLPALRIRQAKFRRGITHPWHSHLRASLAAQLKPT